MNVGRVVALHLKPERGVLTSTSELMAVESHGFEGDRFFGKDSRQALIVSTAELEHFGYQPGDFREQITVDLEGLQELPLDTKIQIGEATLKIEMNCSPCSHQARLLNEDEEEFKAKTSGKRGMLAWVVGSGVIRVEDEVRVLDA